MNQHPSLRWRIQAALIALASAVAVLSAQQTPPPPPPPPPPPSTLATTTVVSGGTGGVVSYVTSGLETAGPSVPQTGTGVLAGRVIDATTNRPIPGVVVSIGGGGAPVARGVPAAPGASTAAARPAVPRILTDANGRFGFRNLPPGEFMLVATKAGYADGGAGRVRPGGSSLPVPVADAERKTDLAIRLFRHGAITGRVIDDLGEPAIGISIRAFRRTIVAGRRRLAPVATAGTTDDRGIYRIPDLMPGEYIVCAQFTTGSVPVGFSTSDDFLATIMVPGSSGYSFSTNGATVAATDRFLFQQSGGAPVPTAGPSGRPLTYAGVCHVSSATVSGGTPVTVVTASERSAVDLAVRLTPAFTIAGHASTPDGPAVNYVLHLIAAEAGELSSDPDVATAITTADGSFMFLGVSAGRYVIQTVRVPRPPAPDPLARGGGAGAVAAAGIGRGATPVPAGPTLWTATPVAVSDTDVADLTIALSVGNTLSGRVEFEGAADPPANLSVIAITVDPADGKPRANVPTVRVGADGRFATAGYPAGQYFVRATILAANWSVRAVTYGGVDISDSPVDLGRGDLAGVVVMLTDRPTRLSGTVTGLGSQDAASVVLFPADTRAWSNYSASPRRLRMTRARAMGEFGFGTVPAGEYFLAAIDDAIAADWQDPRFLDALSLVAQRVTVAEGAQVTRQIQRVAVRPPRERSGAVGSPRESASGGRGGGEAPPQDRAGASASAPRERSGATGPPRESALGGRGGGEAPPQDRDAPRVVATGTASISGVVRTGDGVGEPVGRAKVSLRGADTNVEYTALTDEQGSWRIGRLPAGRYAATVSKPAYVATTYGVERPGQPASAIAVGDGEAATGIVIKLTRGAVITGRVVDEDGGPVPGASISVSRIETVAGERRLVGVAGGPAPIGPFGLRTDDLGQYRAYGLPAGTYVVSVGTSGLSAIQSPLGRDDVRQLSAEDLRAIDSPPGAPAAVGVGAAAPAPFSPMGGRLVGFAPIFHPSALMVDDAGQVTVGAGEERAGVDIRARLVPMVVIRGRVAGIDGLTRLSLITSTTGGISTGGYSSSGVTIVMPEGTFTTRPVSPGRYTLSARGAAPGAPNAMTRVADLDVDVRGDDLDDVVLTLQDGATLRGRIVFDGESAPPSAAAVRVGLSSSVPGRPGSGVSGQTDADGTFVISGVPTGSYRASATVLSSGLVGGVSSGGSGRWYVRGVQYEGRDVADRPLQIQAGQAVDGLVVTMTDRMPELSGTLTDASGRPVPDLTMVLFSTNREDWSPNSRRVRAPEPPDSAGRFVFANVPPGEYYLAAVAQATRNDLADPALLDNIAASAVKVTIGERERKVQDLRIGK